MKRELRLSYSKEAIDVIIAQSAVIILLNLQVGLNGSLSTLDFYEYNNP